MLKKSWSYIYLWGVSNLLPDTDELVGLHGEGLEPDVGGCNPDICQLKILFVKHSNNYELSVAGIPFILLFFLIDRYVVTVIYIIEIFALTNFMLIYIWQT